MNLDILNTAAGGLVAAVLNSYLVAAGIAASTWAFFKLVPSLNAATRHVILWAILAAFVVLPFTSMSFQSTEAVPAVAVQIDQISSSPAVNDPAPLTGGARVEVPVASSWWPVQINAGYLPLAIATVWFLIIIIQLTRVISSYTYLRRVKRSSTPANRELRLTFDEWVLGCRVCRNARLLISDQVESPMAAGFRRPAVIVPREMANQLSGSDLDHVLLHELAHLARRDDWTNLIARIAAGIFALHPAAMWVLRRIDAEREVACDDWVVAMTGASRPYAASLARLVEYRLARRREMLATGIGGRKSQFRSRIDRLIRSGSFDAQASAVKVCMSGLALALMLVIAAHTPQWLAFAQDEPPLAPVAPQTPVSPVMPVHAAMPPHAAAPVEHVSMPPHPASPVTGVPAAPAFLPHPPHPQSMPHPELQPAPPLPPAATQSPSPTLYSFAGGIPAPPRPPSPQAPPTPQRSSEDRRESLLAALASAGYSDLPVEDIINLKNHGVTGSFLIEMNKTGWGKLTVDQLIQLRNHGVTPDYLKTMADVGLKNLTLANAVELRNHGVRPELVREINTLGFGPYDVRQLIDLSTHGARVELFRALKDAGFQGADPKDIIDAANHGLRPSDLRQAKQYGSNLTLRQIIRLKRAGVL